MKKPPSVDLIQDIAIELGVSPSFVEKDWYAVQAIAIISSATIDDFTPIFSGGTSLSKGHGLIERFSEDIDFKLKAGTQKTRNQLKDFRKKIVCAVNEHEALNISNESIRSFDGSKQFSCDLSYPQQFELDQALRQTGLQLEMGYKPIALDAEVRPIASFVSQFTKQEPETSIPCVSPTETAADKFSALVWRILSRDRNDVWNSPKNDPTIIRHLHDLAALKPRVQDDSQFGTLTAKIYESDRGRGGIDQNLSLHDALDRVFETMARERELYQKEYQQFVNAMSYAPQERHIDYDRAHQSFQNLAENLTKLS